MLLRLLFALYHVSFLGTPFFFITLSTISPFPPSFFAQLSYLLPPSYRPCHRFILDQIVALYTTAVHSQQIHSHLTPQTRKTDCGLSPSGKERRHIYRVQLELVVLSCAQAALPWLCFGCANRCRARHCAHLGFDRLEACQPRHSKANGQLVA
ncbi:hypothetical protein B0J11DRAFT_126345 [Dendryphion nanum]|uniref:Uncharacterized protein n=1 Tax=Dendryphion nanum TaxID=256645 RepID=A0A9P9D7L4_9PLEO|nr:hypothetical protein B0J11DRAFT_126345 [Dendryphion nanum]